MILDTAFLVDVLRADDTVREAMQTIDESGRAHVSAITVMELWQGIHLSDASARERNRVDRLLAEIHEVQFDRECAMKAGEILARLQRNGTPIEDADVMIAATALEEEMPVVTKNVDHFERIDGLEIITY